MPDAAVERKGDTLLEYSGILPAIERSRWRCVSACYAPWMVVELHTWYVLFGVGTLSPRKGDGGIT